MICYILPPCAARDRFRVISANGAMQGWNKVSVAGPFFSFPLLVPTTTLLCSSSAIGESIVQRQRMSSDTTHRDDRRTRTHSGLPDNVQQWRISDKAHRVSPFTATTLPAAAKMNPCRFGRKPSCFFFSSHPAQYEYFLRTEYGAGPAREDTCGCVPHPLSHLWYSRSFSPTE